MDLNLVDQILSTFNALPDYRKQGNNQKYAVGDAALSAFSVFFTQSPSFLDYQLRMQKHHNRNNAQSVFGVHQIPSTSQIGNLLDPIAPETLYPMLAEAGDQLYTQGCLEPFISIGGTLLVALDGTDSFSSERISCPCCTRQTLKTATYCTVTQWSRQSSSRPDKAVWCLCRLSLSLPRTVRRNRIANCLRQSVG